MKHVVSISIGSSKRDHRAEVEIMGEKFLIERIGTDGDMDLAVELIRDLDGKVDAFGLGGIDMYIFAGNRRYTIRDSKRFTAAAQQTPMVDGSGLKNSLERKVVSFLKDDLGMELNRRHLLLVSAVDRFGMAEAFAEAGCDMIIGDLMFGLGLPIPLRSLGALSAVARVAAPIAIRLPFHLLYPTGSKQEHSKNKYTKYYEWAEIIAGDYLFISSHMPDNLRGKIIVTNTVTEQDVARLRQKGVQTLITSTPNLGGRSFGTNVLEAVLVTLIGKQPDAIGPEDYLKMLEAVQFTPRVEHLQPSLSA
ncbi:MAG: quinate 5-dehydrogenase [Firmicutes bacterium]|nr:quinate 5-dehydrogenase [Bacillota bacterium]